MQKKYLHLICVKICNYSISNWVEKKGVSQSLIKLKNSKNHNQFEGIYANWYLDKSILGH